MTFNFNRREFVSGLLAAPYFLSAAAADEKADACRVAGKDSSLCADTPPPAKFASNRNCFLYGGGEPIRAFAAAIAVSEDIIAPGGMSIQLNAYPPVSDSPKCVFQQFVMQCLPRGDGFAVLWAVEAWPSRIYRKAFSEGTPCETISVQCKGDLYDEAGTIAVLQTPRIPAGSIFTIAPSDDNGTLTGAVFTFTPPGGKNVTSAVENISTFKFRGSDRMVTPDALASALAYELTLVGPSDGAHAAFTSGAGTVAYAASGPLEVRARAPITLAFRGTTGETSNIAYGDPDGKFTQTFRTAKSAL